MNLGAGQSQGQEGPYSYLVRVTPQYEVTEGTMNLSAKSSLIQVKVSWQERGRERSLSLTTVRSAAQRRV
jgi:hypothetical protein